MLLLDANVFFKKHCFAALYAVFILMPYQTTWFFVDAFILVVVFFFVDFCYLLVGGSLDIWLYSQHTYSICTRRVCTVYRLVSMLRACNWSVKNKVAKRAANLWHHLTVSIMCSIECTHLTPLNVLRAMISFLIRWIIPL